MRLRKVMHSEIENIKHAYRILFMSKLTLEEALVKLEDNQSPYVKEMVNFIKTSQRGISRPK
jgi:UDP-N-acetylglucosamine acyltransferase